MRHNRQQPSRQENTPVTSRSSATQIPAKRPMLLEKRIEMTETKQTRPETYFSPVRYLWATLKKSWSTPSYLLVATLILLTNSHTASALPLAVVTVDKTVQQQIKHNKYIEKTTQIANKFIQQHLSHDAYSFEEGSPEWHKNTAPLVAFNENEIQDIYMQWALSNNTISRDGGYYKEELICPKITLVNILQTGDETTVFYQSKFVGTIILVRSKKTTVTQKDGTYKISIKIKNNKIVAITPENNSTPMPTNRIIDIAKARIKFNYHKTAADIENEKTVLNKVKKLSNLCNTNN